MRAKGKKITATSARIAQILIWVILHVFFCISFIRMRFNSSDKKIVQGRHIDLAPNLTIV